MVDLAQAPYTFELIENSRKTDDFQRNRII